MKKNLYVTRDKVDQGEIEFWYGKAPHLDCEVWIGDGTNDSDWLPIAIAKALGIPIPKKGRGWKLTRETMKSGYTDRSQWSCWQTEKLDPKGGEE